MKRLLSLLFFLITVFHRVLTVHWCYVCEDAECQDSPLANIRQDCRKIFNNQHQHYLCESRQNKTEHTVMKRCILNNPTTIKECDDLNLDKETSCYYCDRELCNTDATTVQDYLIQLKSLNVKYEN